MSKEERKVPELRFKGFHDDWEQRKLNTVVERVTRKNKNNESTLPLTISAQDGLVDQNTYFNKQVASKDMSNYYLLKKGDFAYNKSYSNGFPLGTVKRLDKYDEGTLSSLYIVFRPKKVNSDFLSIYYDTNKWHREVMKLSAEGARNHGLLNIPVNSFFEKKIIIPILEEEQLKIAKFLKRLEKIITLHQRKINTFKQLKKSFLSGMFPIKGENIPRLRFNGYKEEWEQRKLGEVTDVRDGTHDSPKYFKEGYPLITSKNLKNDGLDLDNVSLISKEDFNKFNKRSKVHKGDILFGMIGTIGNPILINRDDFAIKNIALIKQSHEVLNVFIIQLLKSPVFQSYINRENEGGTQKFLSLGKIRDFSFKSPNSEEQNAVSNFLRNLDKSIALHQNKVTNLSILKTTYLRKMFL